MISKKRINECFFDEPIARWYVRGIFYHGYRPIGNYGIMFESPSNELIDIVKYHLGIQPTNEDSTVIQEGLKKPMCRIIIENVPYLNSKLGELGLNVPEEERRFPDDIPKGAISRFSIGFLDSLLPYLQLLGILYQNKEGSPQLAIHYNAPFLRKLYAAWVENGFVKGGKEVNDSPLLLDLENRLSLKSHLYQNLQYLQQYRLYLPATMGLIGRAYTLPGTKFDEKIVRINESLIHRVPIEKIAEQEGYNNITALCRFYKKNTGKTMFQFLGEHRVNEGKALLLKAVQSGQKIDLNKIAKAIGYETVSGFHTVFARVTSETITQFLKKHQSKS